MALSACGKVVDNWAHQASTAGARLPSNYLEASVVTHNYNTSFYPITNSEATKVRAYSIKLFPRMERYEN